jgi:ATP-dependent Lon protease
MLVLSYSPAISPSEGRPPPWINHLNPSDSSNRAGKLSAAYAILEKIAEGRRLLTTAEWRDLLLRSVGLEPPTLSRRAQDITLLRMVPFVERNYNMIELGPRGTGKSHLFQQISPYAHLVSGGKATVARMFVNMSSGQRGLVCQYDVVVLTKYPVSLSIRRTASTS